MEILRFSGHQPFFILFNPAESAQAILNDTLMTKLTPLERKFIILRELVHFSRNHYRIWNAAENLSTEEKVKFVPLIKELFTQTHTLLPTALENKLNKLVAEPESAVIELDGILLEIQQSVESNQLLNMIEFLRDSKPFRNIFNAIADKFALLGVRSIKESTYAILKEEIHEEWMFEEIRNLGLKKLFADGDTFAGIRRRVQDVWMYTLRNYPAK